MSFYQYHLFICTNEREGSCNSCGRFGTQQLRTYAKKRCKELGIHQEGNVRINSAGCLNRCEHGPVMVIYPDEIWYTFIDKEDIDDIIDKHLIKGEIVSRLLVERPLKRGSK